MNNPILSIVIATRNRTEICITTIETLLKIDSFDFQIILHDNSDNRELEQYIINNIKDIRLIYKYSNEVLSFVDNFNKALSYVSGFYITAIGDDDGVNPEIINIAYLAKEKNIESLGCVQSIEYYWPNVIEEYQNGCLLIPTFTGKVSTYDPSKRLVPLLMSGIVNYIPFNLPRLYHGLIRKDILDKIKLDNNTFLRGLSPDIYSSIALSTIINTHTLIDYPFIISGVCNLSGAAASVNSKHCGKLEDAPHFRGNKDYKWEAEVPMYYCVETIWAETALKAIKDHKKESLLKYFNLNFLVAQSILKNPNIRKLIFEVCRLKLIIEKKIFIFFKIKVNLILFILKLRRFFNLIYRFFGKKTDNRNYYFDLPNIGYATIKLNEELSVNPIFKIVKSKL